MDPIILVSAGIGIGVILIFLGLDLMLSGRQAALGSRIDNYATFPVAKPAQPPPSPSGAGRFRRIATAGFSQQIGTELARADLLLTPSEYIIGNIATMLVGFLLGLAIFRGTLLLGVLGGIIGSYLPRLYLRYLQRKRLEAFDRQLDTILILLANALRTGYGLVQAFETVSKEIAPPASVELARVVREFSLGIPIQAALASLLRRNPTLDLDLVITAINVQHEVGGNLSEILDTIASTIRDRVRVQGEIRALTAQQRFSATVLTVMPAGLGLVLYAVNPDYMSLLWQHTCGLMMLGAAAILMGIGYLVIRRLMALRF